MVADEDGHLRVTCVRSLSLTRLCCCTNTSKYWSLDLLHVNISIRWSLLDTMADHRHCYRIQNITLLLQVYNAKTRHQKTGPWKRNRFSNGDSSLWESTVQCPHRLSPTLRKRRDWFPTPSQRAASKAFKAVNISPLLPPQSYLISVRS